MKLYVPLFGSTHLRGRLQRLESQQRQVQRALGTFQVHLSAAGQEALIQQLTELLGELVAIRAQLADTGEGGVP